MELICSHLPEHPHKAIHLPWSLCSSMDRHLAVPTPLTGQSGLFLSVAPRLSHSRLSWWPNSFESTTCLNISDYLECTYNTSHPTLFLMHFSHTPALLSFADFLLVSCFIWSNVRVQQMISVMQPQQHRCMHMLNAHGLTYNGDHPVSTGLQKLSELRRSNIFFCHYSNPEWKLLASVRLIRLTLHTDSSIDYPWSENTVMGIGEFVVLKHCKICLCWDNVA